MKRRNSLLDFKEGFEPVYEDQDSPNERRRNISADIILRDILMDALRSV